MRSTSDDFELFGLEPPVDKADIGQAYRRLVVLHHPDLGGDSQAMARINRARERLLASLEATSAPPPKPRPRRATVTINEDIDMPSPFVYFVWMVLLPAVGLTFMFAVLSMTT